MLNRRDAQVFLSAGGTARSLRHFDQRGKTLGKTTEGWRQPSQDGCTGLARESRLRKNGRAQKVHRGRQP